MLRGLKLFRYVSGLRLLSKVVRSKREEILTAILLAVLTVSLLASVVYLAEKDINPHIRTMWHCYYWAVIALSTVGLGDITPQSVFGKVLFTLGALALIGLFTLPSSIIAAGFTQLQAKQRSQFTKGIIKLDRIDHKLELKLAIRQWSEAVAEIRDEEYEAASHAASMS